MQTRAPCVYAWRVPGFPALFSRGDVCCVYLFSSLARPVSLINHRFLLHTLFVVGRWSRMKDEVSIVSDSIIRLH